VKKQKKKNQELADRRFRIKRAAPTMLENRSPLSKPMPERMYFHADGFPRACRRGRTRHLVVTKCGWA